LGRAVFASQSLICLSHATLSNFESYWKGRQVLRPLPDDELAITPSVIGKFNIAGNYYTGNTSATIEAGTAITEATDYHYKNISF
jgi:hypothetical protein